jgi:hypothetical protein
MIVNEILEGSNDQKRIYEEIDITPEMAKEILDADTYNNRPLSKTNVNFLVKEMEIGNWLFDGSPIRFNQNNELIDGRHRLTALVKANKTYKFSVIRGLDNESFKVMDTGDKRDGADMLAIAGVKNYCQTAAVIKTIFGFRKNLFSHNRSTIRTLSNADILEYYDLLGEEGNIDGSITFGLHYYKKYAICNATTLSSFHYLFSLINKEDADIFIHKLSSGEMLEANSPIAILRNKLIRKKMDKEFDLTQTSVNAYIVMAWNKFRCGEKCKRLTLPEKVSDYNFNIL